MNEIIGQRQVGAVECKVSGAVGVGPTYIKSVALLAHGLDNFYVISAVVILDEEDFQVRLGDSVRETFIFIWLWSQLD